MCGRYTLFAPPDDIEERFGATFEYAFELRYNAAPRQDLPVIAGDAPESIQHMDWGLVPSWADDRSDFGFINARAETLAEKPSFSDAFERRRCLVLADGFYEWSETGEGKQPYRVTLSDGQPFAMAGLWERWTPPDAQAGLDDFTGGGSGSGDDPGDGHDDGSDDGSVDPGGPAPVETFTIVTCEPNDLVADLHHRMAVVLAPDEERTWLTADADAAADLLDPYPAGEMRAYPVSTAVNDPSNDAPGLVEEVELGS